MNVNKSKQRYSLTEDHLEDILKTSISYVTSEYEKLRAENRCSISHYVCKVVRKTTNVFFQRNTFLFVFRYL
jgi:hypothetical protein